jgi:glucokinase
VSAAAEARVIAVDVGGTAIKAAVLDDGGRTSRRVEHSTPVSEGPSAVIDAVRQTARDLAGPELVAAGVVVPGSVDVATGTARYSANIGWRDVPLRDLLTADLGVPVTVEHDVRAAGLAECTLGRARGVSNCLIAVIGTGIAGLVVAGGAAQRGAVDMAGEIGHLPVYPDGETCACGQRGCLETYASAAAIRRRYRAAGGGAMDTPAIVAARDSDPRADRVWRDATEALGLALVSATMLLDPALVVLAGGLAAAGTVLLDPVREALGTRLAWRSAPPVELSPLAARAGLLGAALLAWRCVGRTDFSTWTVA